MRFARLLILLALLGCAHEDQRPAATGRPATTTTVYVDHPPPSYTPSTTAVEAKAKRKPKRHSDEIQGDVWYRLFGCETGYTYNIRAVSPSGRYRGAFQFDLTTWASVGMTGDPINYTYEEQKAAAMRLQARDGWGKWPTCRITLGLA